MLAPGTTFHRYRVEQRIGSGGMGEVYRAYDPALKRHIALKVLRPETSDGTPRADAVARALREAQSAAALRHPNAIVVYDIGEVDGAPFIAMELLDGKSLTATLETDAPPLRTRVRWLVQVARALDAAHRVGLVHRDVKPDNVMICADGNAKVLDFGIAKRTATTALADTRDAGPASFETASGLVVGTPRYMAPEQLAGEPLDAKSDQFAWGLLAYECIGGAGAIDPSREAYARVFARQPPKLLSELVPGLPMEMAVTVARALAMDPARRWPTLADAADALEPFATGAALAEVGATPAAGTVSAIAARPKAPTEPTPRPPAQQTPFKVRHAPVKIRQTPVDEPPKRSRATALLAAAAALGIGAAAVALATRPHAPSAIPGTDAALGPADVAIVVAASEASAPIVSAVPLASTSAPSPLAPAPSVRRACRCVRGSHALCSEASWREPLACECTDPAMLCAHAVPVGGRCDVRTVITPRGAKQGDACTGYRVFVIGDPAEAAKLRTGTLASCDCTSKSEFSGVTGAECIGFDGPTHRVSGTLRCD